ncbi:vancomycin high temperature exclusion protein [Roseivirga sp. BDSF3-8]|uniref:SanA/YdcF family protein n=1 Tax=Roseivirga sp. BDSF3-8 TaxID=3241598 RepID=UPI00353230F1
MKAFKKIARISLILLACMLSGVAVANMWVILSTDDQVFHEIDSLPETDVALVLGTSKRLRGGYVNSFFAYRMEAAARLFKEGKVRHFILSGDNNTVYYNEPVDMQKALMDLGVPDSVITLDYAGFRTLDSVVRSKEIFGQNSIIIVTQEFHSYRALFIAEHYDMRAVAYAAEVQPLDKSFKVLAREMLARPKAILDLYFLDISPKFLGKKETLPID